MGERPLNMGPSCIYYQRNTWFPHEFICLYRMDGEPRSCPSCGDTTLCQRMEEDNRPLTQFVSAELMKHRKPNVTIFTINTALDHHGQRLYAYWMMAKQQKNTDEDQK